MEDVIERLERVENKIDKLLKILDGDFKKNTEKMGSHIDFIEKVYDNVKAPLGYICNKVKLLTGNKSYELEDI